MGAHGSARSTTCGPETDCCTFAGTTWRFSGPEPLGSLPLPPNMKPRDYSSTSIQKAIINVDAEEIGPEDIPHHPLDSMREAKFERKPWGLAVNSRTEQIYLADRQYHNILVFGPDGSFQRTFGGEGVTSGLFRRPTAIAYDAAHDRIIVTDKDNHRIQALDATTIGFLFAFGCQGRLPGQFNFPWGVAVSLTGNLIAVSDARNARIQLFSADGKYLSSHYFRKNSSTTNLKPRTANPYPRGLVFDSQGIHLYISDFNMHHVVRLNLSTRRMDIFASGLYRPSGLALDNAGNLLVCDARNDKLKVFRCDGVLLGSISTIGEDRLEMPLDVAVLPAGYIALMDLNGRIRLF